jgi:AcrR family transcriptional regulator
MRSAKAGGGDTTPEDSAPRRLGRRRDDSRDPEILRAALDVLAETGYERMTMDAVALKAKAGKATMYRRWPSKAQLVLDAITSTSLLGTTAPALPDTGSLRGDLLALAAHGPSEEDSRKLQIMAGLISALPYHSDLAAIFQERLVAPRTALMRELLQRATARGEIAPGRDLDTLAMVGPAISAYQIVIMNKSIDQDFYTKIIDQVLIPLTLGTSTPPSGQDPPDRLS